MWNYWNDGGLCNRALLNDTLTAVGQQMEMQGRCYVIMTVTFSWILCLYYK